MAINIYSMQTSKTGPYLVRVMDGQAVRDTSLSLQEFGLTAISNDFPNIIPKDEIWISERLPIGEFSFVMSGVITRLRCLEQGIDEGKAYDRGIAKEKAERGKHGGRSKDKQRDNNDGHPQVIIDDTGYAHIVGDGSETPVHVYLVDADLVRNHFKTDFLEGGNGAVYDWVPNDQIWLESDLNDTEIPYVALHEYVERLLMLRRGLDYDTAHDLASKVEFAHRSDGVMLQTDVMALTPAILDEVPDGKDKTKKDEKSLHQDINEAARETDTNPTEAQKKSGTYRKGKFNLQGLPISIENPKGSTRSGTGKDGVQWSVYMMYHYGYIRRTESEADGDHIDVFIGPYPESELVYIVNQVNEEGSFDEHKCLLGFRSIGEAKSAYLACYTPGWQGLGSIEGLHIDLFKEWLKTGDTNIPFEIDHVKATLLAKSLDLGSEQSQLERAKQADLIEFPPNVDGTRCSNCQFIDSGYCYHSKVDQIINKPETMCCRFWDSPGTKREWEESESKAMSAFNELSGGALVAPPEYKLPLLPLERNRGQRSLLSDPEGLKRMRTLRAKYKAGSYFGDCPRDDTGHCLPSGQADQSKQPKPPEAKPTRMGTGNDEHIVSHGEKKPEPEQQESKPIPQQQPAQTGTFEELSANLESQQEQEAEVRDKLIEKERKQIEKRAKRQRQEEDKARKRKHTKEQQGIESAYERQRNKYAKNRSREEDTIVEKMTDQEFDTVWPQIKTKRDAEDAEFYKNVDDEELMELKKLWEKQEQEDKLIEESREKEDDETHSKWDDQDDERWSKDAEELDDRILKLQPAPKQEQKSGTWKTVRGCRVFVENGKITKGPPALLNLNQKDITPQWAKAEDAYRGIRSLKTLRQKYRRK